MKNVVHNSENYKAPYEILNDYNKYNLKEKIETLRNLSRNITYNEDQQNFCYRNNFLEMILNDIHNFLTEPSSSECLKDNEIYVKLFFLFFHNLIVGNSESQSKVFEDLFLNSKNFNNLSLITNSYIYDNKIKKFLLSIFFNLIFSNSKNISRFNKAHFEYLLKVLKSLNYNVTIIELQNDKDLSEINDWIHILLKHILKSELRIKLSEESDSCLTIVHHLLDITEKSDRILVLELLRDYVDYAKDSNTLYIYEENLKLFNILFYQNILCILSNIETIQNTSFAEYEKLKFDYESDISFTFREFLCLVDLLSVFLTSEDNFYNYRKSIQTHLDSIHQSNNYTILIEIFYSLLSLTDNFYESTFKRNRSLTLEEAKGVPKLDEKNILYGFQTNVMKILSNYSLKNEGLKSYLIEKPDVFYYFLNHMKLDKCNPFKKEWTVLFVKSAAEENHKIQSFINDLQPHSIDPLLKDYIINKGTNVKVDGPDKLNSLNKNGINEEDLE
jgi:hypothetical protein